MARKSPSFAQTVRSRRVALGLNQTQLAARVGTHQPVISYIESGRLNPDEQLEQRIRAVLADDTVAA